MNDPRLNDLMNRELDGCNTPQESRILRERLLEEPEAREYFRQLRHAVEALDDIELEEPPAGLRAAILAAQAGGVHHAPERETGIPGALRDLARTAVLVPLAAGLVAGLLVSNLVLRGVDDTNGLGGTAGAERQDLVPAGNVPLDLTAAGATGNLWVESDADRTTCRLSLTANTPLEIVLELGPATVCRGYRLDGETRPTLHVSRHGVTVLDAATGDYEFFFGHAGENASDISLKIIHEGRIITETLVRPGQDR